MLTLCIHPMYAMNSIGLDIVYLRDACASGCLEKPVPESRVTPSTLYFMSSSSTTKRIGGEYGSVRASFDVESLNAYLEKNVQEIKTPVNVKQFKVCHFSCPPCRHAEACSLDK